MDWHGSFLRENRTRVGEVRRFASDWIFELMG
jgi:hypothetical protein